MHAIYQLLAVVAAATLTSTRMVRTSSDEEKNFELLILHNNDMHARFEQTSQQLGTCTPDDREKGKCYGGFARVAHVVKEARLAAATGTGPPVLYLNAGDTYTGSAWFTLYKWKIAAEFINAIQPDAMSLGNHEFDHGVEGLIPFIDAVSCPIVAANLDLTKVPELEKETNVKKYAIFNISGIEIGIIGYLTPETKSLAVANDVEYIDEIVALQNEVSNLRKLGVKTIIALGHSGYTRDQEIAKAVDGLDLIIGGHSHTFLWTGTPPDYETPEGDYPTYVTQDSGKKVPVVQAFAFTKYMGKLHLTFNSQGEMIGFNGVQIVLDKTIPEDPDTLSIVEKYRKQMQEFYKVIGKTSVSLDNNCDKKECNLGNLITDSIVYHYTSLYKGGQWTDASIAVLQAGGIRAPIVHSQFPAEVTKEDLLTVLPFKGHLVAMAMNGSMLRSMLEHAVSRYDIPKVGEFLQVSGIKVVFNVMKPVGHRVEKVEARCSNCNIPEYFDVNNNATYKVIMTDFVSMGGDGFSMLKGMPVVNLDFNELLATQHYIEKHSPVSPALEQRITIIEEPLKNTASKVLLCAFLVAIVTIINLSV